MKPSVSTRDPDAVQSVAHSAYTAIYPDADQGFAGRVFGWAKLFFSGGYPGYQRVDTQYHDFEHTLQGVLCMARLLFGRHQAGAEPKLSRRVFELSILAMLLHDTGYLKKEGDVEGTGAKYTATHVDRSAQFAADFLSAKQFPAKDIHAIQCMIRCTGVNADVDKIPFANEQERIGGYALATADYLGQMAAEDYIEKLPVLFEEFAEAKAFTPANQKLFAEFKTAQDLLDQTPAFWSRFVKPKLEHEFLGLYRFLNEPYPNGDNAYLLSVEANVNKAAALATRQG